MKNPFDYLYSEQRSIESLGDLYKPPSQFKHCVKRLVAKIKAHGDGQSVRIYETRLPATFFDIVVTKKGKQPGYTVGMGTVDPELAGSIAQGIASGMIDFRSLPRKQK